MFDIVVNQINNFIPYIPTFIGYVITFDMIRLLIFGRGGN